MNLSAPKTVKIEKFVNFCHCFAFYKNQDKMLLIESRTFLTCYMTYLESSKKFLPQKMPHLLLGQGMSQNLEEMTSETEKKQLTNCQSVILFCNITKTKEKS
jgi:hypothetical protein